MSHGLEREDHSIVDLKQPDFRPVGIPLSPGCYQATAAERLKYATLVRGRVESLLRDEAHYAERQTRNDSFLHAGEWKQVKKEKELTFYRRFQRGRSLRELALEEELPEIQRAVERGYTSMICDGYIKGTIEDFMYGMTASSQDDLMTGFSYKDPPKDCVWLGTKLPPMIDQVDVCYLKATGVQLDANGNRYGYLVVHGVHLVQCPVYAAHGISRAKMYFAGLFRESHKGVLKVTVRGIFDLSKKVRMLKGLVSAATKSIMVGIFNGVGIGEAKKLTLLALRHRSQLQEPVNTQRQSQCYMCCKRASFLGRANLFGTYVVTCYVCGSTVCSNCTQGIKQRVFLGLASACSKVDCCPSCVHEAITTIHVSLAEPEFLVVAEYFRKEHSVLSSGMHSDALQNHGLKTNSSAGIPTASTTERSAGEYQLDFEEDAFSGALSMPMLRKSSAEDSEVEPSSDADASDIKPWRHRIDLDDDDFIPSSAADRLYGAMQLERRLLALKIQADQLHATINMRHV